VRSVRRTGAVNHRPRIEFRCEIGRGVVAGGRRGGAFGDCLDEEPVVARGDPQHPYNTAIPELEAGLFEQWPIAGERDQDAVHRFGVFELRREPFAESGDGPAAGQIEPSGAGAGLLDPQGAIVADFELEAGGDDLRSGVLVEPGAEGDGPVVEIGLELLDLVGPFELAALDPRGELGVEPGVGLLDIDRDAPGAGFGAWLVDALDDGDLDAPGEVPGLVVVEVRLAPPRRRVARQGDRGEHGDGDRRDEQQRDGDQRGAERDAVDERQRPGPERCGGVNAEEPAHEQRLAAEGSSVCGAVC